MVSQKGYCDVCKKEYANIYQHKRTKMHKERAEQESQPENTQDNIKVVESEPEQEQDIPESNDNRIQIIEGEPKEQKSAVKEVMEIAFSEQFAPITMSILQAFAQRVQGTHNPEQTEGKIQTQAGQLIEDF